MVSCGQPAQQCSAIRPGGSDCVSQRPILFGVRLATDLRTGIGWKLGSAGVIRIDQLPRVRIRPPLVYLLQNVGSVFGYARGNSRDILSKADPEPIEFGFYDLIETVLKSFGFVLCGR